jgi:Class III cytochrome C family
MQVSKRIMKTAIALTIVGLMLSPMELLSMEAEDAPETLTIESMANLYGPVEFNHLMHTEYASCEECHHHTTGDKVVDPNCARCHSNSGEGDEITCTGCHETNRFNKDYLKTLESPTLYHIDKPGLKGAYHLNCIGCHEIISGPTGCQECHTMTEAGEKMFNTGAFAPAKGTSPSGH